MRKVIICVDDEKIVLDSLKSLLRKEFSDEYDFEFAESGEEAIEIIEDFIEEGVDIPVIISDQIMPGMKGDVFLCKVENISPDSLKILLTGQASAESIGNAVNNANLFRYIPKPWNNQDLTMTIREANKSFSQDKEILEKKKQLLNLVEELNHLNKSLENKVAKRISEISKSFSLIFALVTHFFKDYFIYFKPRDIVSGDFYFFKQFGTKLVIAAADCTGQGVPGAIMSMVEINAIHLACDKTNGMYPDKILNFLHSHTRKIFNQKNKDSVQDGMDIAICTYDSSTNELFFSGAKNPLIYIQDNEEGVAKLFIIKGDRVSIGGYQEEEKRIFTRNTILIDKPTSCYLLTDGFQNQFGGKIKGKFGLQRLKNLLTEVHKKPFVEQKEILNSSLKEWKEDINILSSVVILKFHYVSKYYFCRLNYQ